MPTEIRKLIMFANCSNPSSSFVIKEVSIYTGIIPCLIPPNNKHVFESTFAQYSVNTPRLDRLGSNVRWIVWEATYCLDTTYVQEVFLKNDAKYGGSLGQK